VRVFRIAIFALGLVFLVLAINRLNVREIDKPGLCGSLVQGSSHDDGGASTPDCNRLRHHDGVATAVFFVLAIASFGLVVGHVLHTARGSRA
jgi:hypothetical protein